MNYRDFIFFSLSRCTNIIFPIILLPFVLVVLGHRQYVTFVVEFSVVQIIIMIVKFGTEQFGLVECSKLSLEKEISEFQQKIVDLIMLRLCLLCVIMLMAYFTSKIVNYQFSYFALIYVVIEVLIPIFVFQILQKNTTYSIFLIISRLIVLLVLAFIYFNLKVNIHAIWIALAMGSIVMSLSLMVVIWGFTNVPKLPSLMKLKDDFFASLNYALNVMGSGLRDRLFFILASSTIESNVLATFDILYRYALSMVAPVHIMANYYCRIFVSVPQNRLFRITSVDFITLGLILCIFTLYIVIFIVFLPAQSFFTLEINSGSFMIALIGISTILPAAVTSWVVNTRLFVLKDAWIKFIPFGALLFSLLLSQILKPNWNINYVLLYCWLSTLCFECLIVMFRCHVISAKVD